MPLWTAVSRKSTSLCVRHALFLFSFLDVCFFVFFGLVQSAFGFWPSSCSIRSPDREESTPQKLARITYQ